MKQILEKYKTIFEKENVLEKYSKSKKFNFFGTPKSAVSLISSSLYLSSKKQILFIAPTNQEALNYFSEFQSFLPLEEISYFPGFEGIPYDYAHYNQETKIDRITCLSKILDEKKSIIITSVSGFLKKLPSPKNLLKESILLKKDSEYSQEIFLKKLIELGYSRESICEDFGSFSVKGGVIDVFTPNFENPIRFDFFGDSIESIKIFSAGTQKSISEIKEILILPVSEFSFNSKEWEIYKNQIESMPSVLKKPSLDLKTPLEELSSFVKPFSSFLSYFPKEFILIFSNANEVSERANHFIREYKTLFEKRKNEIICAEVESILSVENELKLLSEKNGIDFKLLKPSEISENEMNLELEEAPNFKGKIKELKEKISELISSEKIILTSSFQAQTERMLSLFEEEKISAITNLEKIENFSIPKNNGLYIILSEIKNGFHIPEENFHLWTENDIFGRTYKRKSKFKKISSKAIHSFVDLKEGDFVVHVNHGVGKFLSIEKVSADGTIRDFLKLEYSGGDTLFIPLNQISLIQRYIGGTEKPVLDNLGKGSWKKKKEKAEGVITKLAEELLVMYSNRMELRGFSFPPDTIWQEEFESEFIYEETEDQLSAIEAVKSDMESNRPMDRLVCGDVGYGKTEIAIRASFKAVMSGKQVMFIAPTTILALQHFNNLSERYKNFPIRLGMISRFRTGKQIKEDSSKFSTGEIDILIGTHALLSNNIKAKNLGLLIIDEEQRFGVNHKETIKKIKNLVDVLTLSATPIPRTLHMSLAGIRDLSIIETPPKNRQSVETYVLAENEEVIRLAIKKELERDGQVFYLHNRVESIEQEAYSLSKILPQISIGVLHGQLTEEEVEETLIDFQNKKYDVLVTTTIIESGIDMPNVNTMIVKKADSFGLSQLYQIRGRVGRGNKKAYAYLFYDPMKSLTEQAEKRLNTISEYQELGSGFKVAMRDLEIRGAGNLLGTEQSGSIMDIGFDLYVKMLNDEVSKLKKETIEIETRTTVTLSTNFYIPENYIKDTKQKIEFYKKLEGALSLDEVDDISLEMMDRFGEYPSEVEIFLLQQKIRVLGSNLGFEFITESNDEIKFKSNENFKGKPEKIVKLLNSKEGLSILPKEARVLKFKPKHQEPEKRLKEILSLIQKLV